MFDQVGSVLEKPKAVLMAVPGDLAKIGMTAAVFAGLLYAKGHLLGSAEDKPLMKDVKKGAAAALGLYVGMKMLA